MRVIKSAAEMRTVSADSPAPLGLVPTMGFLHAGHISLIERARRSCATVAVSIFVNPTQFGPKEDFARYPRDLPRDLRMCETAGVDIVFAPTASELYPPHFASYIEVHGLQDLWEGASRPGHFRGVATVVALLFRIVRPATAYFGEKDYQQLQIIHRMSRDLHLDVDVTACATVREPDGLAMSSRNAYLDAESRTRALALSSALRSAQETFAAGEHDPSRISQAMNAVLAATPGVEVDYAALVDAETLEMATSVSETTRALIATRIGGVRLIDNAALGAALARL